MKIPLLKHFGLAAAGFCVTAAALAAENGRDPAAIAAVIDRHKQEIATVYNTYLDAGLELEGTVVVEFTIARTGAVTASDVYEADTDCKLFEEAIAAAVTKWDFGPASGEPVTVRYPFTFTLPSSPSSP